MASNQTAMTGSYVRGRQLFPAQTSRTDSLFPTRIAVADYAETDSASNKGDLRREFQKHERKWKRDTQYISAPTPKYLHPSYARIIGLGPVAIGMILESLQREPDDWFYALRALTGANPVTPSMAGDMRKMTSAWLKWAKGRSLV